jgi:pantetheine-phosphate adenylyltransferase
MKRAIYPGTFDPITLGHLDVLARAVRIFDEVLIAVAEDSGKDATFNVAERVQLIRECLGKEPWAERVRVASFQGLLVEFARKEEAVAVIRGLRAVSDFEYEFQLAGMNRHLIPEVETIFLTPDEKYMFVSATIVREIAVLGGSTGEFVHPLVERRLRDKVAQLGGSN